MITTFATINHSNPDDASRVQIGYDAAQRIIVAREAGGDWEDACCGEQADLFSAVDAAEAAWSDDEWDLQLDEAVCYPAG